MRGILSWVTESRVYASIGRYADNGEVTWSVPLKDPKGSVIPEPVDDSVGLRFMPQNPAISVDPRPARLERLDPDGAVRTRIWDMANLEEVRLTLAHIPDYGYFHRLVIRADRMTWDEDWIIKQGSDLVRFTHDPVTGEVTPPLDRIEPNASGYQITGGKVGTQTLEGRFMDIVASGQTPTEAKTRARGIYGLVTLVFGDQAVAETVFGNDLDAQPFQPQQSQAAVDVTALPILSLPEEAFSYLDALMDRVNQAASDSKRLNLSLHWYQQGCEARASIDQFMWFFFGIETLLKGFTKNAGGVESAKKRKAKYEDALRKAFSKTFEKDVLNSLIDHLGRPSLNEEFRSYCLSIGVSESEAKVFSALGRIRNSLVHGETSEPPPEMLHEVRRLHVKLLRTELSIDFQVPWERSMPLTEIRIPFSYTEYGYHG